MNGIQLIAAERTRQIEDEGWKAEHDDKHRGKQLAKAASSYLEAWTSPDVTITPRCFSQSDPSWDWPWTKKWWKPSDDPIRNLVKAGALIAAEIDRLQRRKEKKVAA